jgi:hypothetical protein
MKGICPILLTKHHNCECEKMWTRWCLCRTIFRCDAALLFGQVNVFCYKDCGALHHKSIDNWYRIMHNFAIQWFIDFPMNSICNYPGSTGVMIFLHFRLLHFFLKLSIVNYQLSIISPTSSHHRGTRSAQRACRQAKDKLFEPPSGGELFVF